MLMHSQTFSGLFCLTVNPWRWLPLYTKDIMHMYEGQAKNRPPHVYQIANTAYLNIVNGGGDQSILITLVTWHFNFLLLQWRVGRGQDGEHEEAHPVLHGRCRPVE